LSLIDRNDPESVQVIDFGIRGTELAYTLLDEYDTLVLVYSTPRGAKLVMHELAIAQSIVEAVETKASECNASHVKVIRLKIGEASGVVTDSLTFCFEMLASLDPTLAGAQLLIDTMPHYAYCRYCAREFSVTNFVAQCPTCKEWSDQIISGTELQILEMEFET
jgi:hydrogenase nickel incorporation protein HypA/HybF